MVIVAVALFLIFGGLMGYVFMTQPYAPMRLHSDDCKICQEDMRRGED